MRLNIGFYLLILLVSCLHKLRANQDVDGTIAWVDNDKKEKDITVAAPSTLDNGEMKYWKFADNRIDHGPTMFVGNEDTPSTVIHHHHEGSVEPSDSIEAHYVKGGTDEEHVDIDDNQNNEAETHDDGTHYDGALTEHFSSPMSQTEHLSSPMSQTEHLSSPVSQTEHLSSPMSQLDTPVERLESSNLKSEVGGDSEVEADEDDEGKNLVSSDKEQIEAADTILDSLSDDHAEREIVTETADTKATIQRHQNNTKGLHEKSSDVSGKARSILYDGLNVKKDHGVGETAGDNYGGELTRNSLGSYAPDDNDITDIVSHYTDNKSEDRHRMGRDELQMHLDDEALKMEVKEIEEEDSNVKSVLQGAEKFANGQKMGHLEGDYEKDLIKDIGKDKVDVEAGNDGNKNGDVEMAEDSKDDDNERRGTGRNEDEEEEGEEEKEKPQERSNDDEIEDKQEDENGERKHLISKHKDSKHSAPGKIKHRKYRLFGASTGQGNALPDDPDWRVDYDNEAMESEVKAIEAADSKVNAALQGIKSHSSQDIDEYKYDNPQFYSADGRPIHRHHHRAAKKHLTGKLLDEKSKEKQGNSEKQQTGFASFVDSKVTDEISAMLQETSAVLNQTNAILDERLFNVSKPSVIDSVSNAAAKAVNETSEASGGNSSAVNSLNATETSANHTVDVKNKTSDLNVVSNNSIKTSHSNYDSLSNSSSSDGREKKISTEAPSKRDLKRDDGYGAKKSTRHGRRKTHGSRKLKHETNKALPIKNINKHVKSSNRNDSKQKYNGQELRILKLMYPTLAVRHTRNKSHKQHEKDIEKRFITPGAKGRSKKKRNLHRHDSDIGSGGKHGFRRLLAKRKPTASKEVNEVGSRREEVQEGMTGAISYTNRDGNEFMFAVSRATLTWSEASSKCQSLGGELVSIGDKEEQEFIQTNVIPEKGHYWIGFADQEEEGVWQWKDKTPVRYTNWSNLEPDDGNIKNGEATHNEDCAVINPTMDWSDVPCWNRFQFICKLSPDNGRAISFGGTMSHSDVGNKQFDGFAESLKNKPSIPTKKPVKEINAKTRDKTNEMKKGYSGQGPSRGGYQAEEEAPVKTEQTVKANSAMVQGKEAGVPGGAEASTARTANALAQATSNAVANKKPVQSPAPAAMKAGKYVNAGGGGGQPGVTGLGSVPGVTAAAFNANAGLGKIGGAGGGGQQSAVQQGGNGGQSSMNMAQSGGGANMGGGAQGGGGNGGGGANMGGGAQGGGGNGGNMGGARPMPAGANGGAPGHVATNGGLAQAPNNGAPAGGGNQGGGNMAGPAAGGRVPAGNGGGGGAMPAAGNGGAAPARPGNVGGGRPAVMQAPAGGMQAPAGGMQAPAGGMQAPAGGMQAPAGGMQAPQNKPAAQAGGGGGGPSGGGGGGAPELSPLQAKVAQQLANVMAPQLEREYASKFEPEMEMMKTICGKLCADVAIALPNEDAEKTGKACGGICARSLLRKSPEEAMDLLIGLAKGGGSRPTAPVMAVPTGAIPVAVPVNGAGTGGGTGNNGGNAQGNGGNSNTGGGNGGGSNGEGSSGGGGSSDGGGGNTGGGGNAGGGSSSSNNGGGNNFEFGNGKPINLEALGAKFASKLGLNVNSDGKLAASNGDSIKEKLTEAISNLKSENNLKTSTASKSILPGRRSKHKVVKVQGYYTLKKTGDAMVSPTKKHEVRKSKKKHFRKSKKSSKGPKKSKKSKKSSAESKKSSADSKKSSAESKKSTEESKKPTEESKKSIEESNETTESEKSTEESKKSTEESTKSSAESNKSTEEKKSTDESNETTESKKSTEESKKSLTGSEKSLPGSKKSLTGSKKSLKGSGSNIRKKVFIMTL